MKKSTVSIVLGLIVIAFGIFYGGEAFGLWNYHITFNGWWSMFIILPCLLSIFSGGINFFNCVGTGIGVLILLNEQGVLKNGLGFKLIFPFVLVIFGFSILLKKPIKVNKEGNNGVYAGSRGDNYFAVFGGNSPHFKDVDFRGANTYAIFGSVEMKLQSAIIRRDCEINTYTVFGGTDIILPKNVRVIVESTPILGGVNNRFVMETTESNAPTVLIRALTIFGSADIS